MKIKTIVTGELEENCYILKSEENDILIVDPGADFERIDKEIDGNVCGVLITHRHFDHIGALNQVLEKYRVPLYEYANLEEETYHARSFQFQVFFFKGHSKDSVGYYFVSEKAMFSGDFIFYHGIGRCDLEGGSIKEMKESIARVKRLPHDITIYPGHGRATSLQEECDNNAYFN